ncbi:hypothetical protein [Longimicrobium sp.]|uniref:hypothetical protein n=1 Tax=Longimicrobium sp. TaxID=2029185 RepID=UPI002BF6E964|nr:hypothetical protein [Longimicrobium sp.]HSU16798.1 hypothetical protein [Longimicrobium sp.]
MSTRNPEPERTDETVRARYRAWADANPRPRGPSAIGMPEVSEGTMRLAGLAVGVVVGLSLLALAVTAFVAAQSWSTIGRGGAVVAYFLTGSFLAIAGVGCIWAVLNHNFRVLAGPPAHH